VRPKHVACIDMTNKICFGWRQPLCQYSKFETSL